MSLRGPAGVGSALSEAPQGPVQKNLSEVYLASRSMLTQVLEMSFSPAREAHFREIRSPIAPQLPHPGPGAPPDAPPGSYRRSSRRSARRSSLVLLPSSLF